MGSPVNARKEVLAQVRRALADVPDSPLPDVPRAYDRSLPLNHRQVLDLFAERVADYRATVRRVARGNLVTAIAETLVRREVHRLVVPPDLPSRWAPAALHVVPDVDLSAADLDRVDGVLTAAAAGIAVSGTVVLDGGAGQGRRAITLVPDYHLCVVDGRDVVGSVPEAVARMRSDRPITLISGPSATSDIEFSRVEGVHGPRRLDVLLVDGDGTGAAGAPRSSVGSAGR